MIRCNLCGIVFKDDFELRKPVHERWHKNCIKEKRNTTEGIVIWES
jgi:hypothetical protein